MKYDLKKIHSKNFHEEHRTKDETMSDTLYSSRT